MTEHVSQQHEEPTSEQEEAIWQGLLEVERQEAAVFGARQASTEAYVVRNAANRIAYVGHADFLMEVIRKRGGGVKYNGRWCRVSSQPFCSVPGYESYRAVD